MRCSPNSAVTSQEDALAGDVFCQPSGGTFRFIGQDDVPVLALAGTDGQRAAVIVVVFVFQTREFRIAAPRVQSANSIP
jgi:hypothetical protein